MLKVASAEYRRSLDSGRVSDDMVANSTISPAVRAPWNDAGEVAILVRERETKSHDDYLAGKTGDIDAASQLVSDLMQESGVVSKLSRQIRKTDPVVVPVTALEDISYNFIPLAMADYIGVKFGLRTVTHILQRNRVAHTGSSGYHRLATPALFTGEVVAGEEYLLVDDFIGQGGTLANLRGYITSQGGNVVGMASLTGQRRSAILAVTDGTLQALREKHENLESWWEDIFGYGFGSLTESEARYLLRSPDADTIRARINKAAREAGQR